MMPAESVICVREASIFSVGSTNVFFIDSLQSAGDVALQLASRAARSGPLHRIRNSFVCNTCDFQWHVKLLRLSYMSLSELRRAQRLGFAKR